MWQPPSFVRGPALWPRQVPFFSQSGLQAAQPEASVMRVFAAAQYPREAASHFLSRAAVFRPDQGRAEDVARVVLERGLRFFTLFFCGHELI